MLATLATDTPALGMPVARISTPALHRSERQISVRPRCLVFAPRPVPWRNPFDGGVEEKRLA